MNTDSIRIWYDNLVAIGDAETCGPLSSLTAESHIHGALRIEIAGRMVPRLNYDPNDACFGEWLNQLWLAAVAFKNSDRARHVFDEGEQGNPAFIFERTGDRGYFTIADSDISGAKGEQDWQRVPFSTVDFLREHSRFRTSFFEAIRAAAPDAAEGWIKAHIRE